ncbi:Uncharacterised protein [Escherichia coli]|nr:Uncharacterised protein [Escherichia coli]SQY58590.1 Uncharacterised protein [Escherichia coli]SQY97709.1 Uncharacterised protein [Escherichia coli]
MGKWCETGNNADRQKTGRFSGGQLILKEGARANQ